ncbi:MAG: DUF6531 domain-containing protein [Pseudomonadales bacterium]|nr:DUF6531 domain-containing protein [Pseudomonadales bacterium]
MNYCVSTWSNSWCNCGVGVCWWHWTYNTKSRYLSGSCPELTGPNGQCYSNPEGCPEGTVQDGSQCVLPPESCSDGSDPINGACPVEAEKQFGPSCSKDETAGNPCNATTGNKYQSETDYSGGALTWRRHYNSGAADLDGPLGFGWSHDFSNRLDIQNDQLAMRRGSGKVLRFDGLDGLWNSDADVDPLLVTNTGGFLVTHPNGDQEQYDNAGLLIWKQNPVGLRTQFGYDSNANLVSITGPYGHGLALAYDTNQRIITVTDSAGGLINHSYDNSGNLSSVTYADGTVRTYHYEDASHPHALTGITDANGSRFSTYGYNGDGKAILTKHAATTNSVGQEQFTLNYDSETLTTVTNAVGDAELVTFSKNLGIRNLISRKFIADGKGITQTFDANNNKLSRTDAEGNTTLYTYNGFNQRTSMTEAAGTSEARTTTYSYLSNDLDLPTMITRDGVTGPQTNVTTTQYDAALNPIRITQQGFKTDGSVISRQTQFGYDSNGRLISIDGPRSDVADTTVLSYHQCTSGNQCGQLATVTNALGHITSYTVYNAHGQLTSMTDVNGIVTDLVYDARQRLVTQTINGSRTTQYGYDSVGQLTQLILPDGSSFVYTYDAAHDLTRITDSSGDFISYSYDAKGNRTGETTQSNGGVISRNLQRGYDLRDYVNQVNDRGTNLSLVNDARGSATNTTDAREQSYHYLFDALNRLVTETDPDTFQVSYSYDSQDRVKTVTDQRGLITTYTYDDLGNLLSRNSPDTGLTSYDSYDAAGNLLQQTDALGVTTKYHYDGLNRLTHIEYAESQQDIVYHYDGGNYQAEDQPPAVHSPIGRLTGMVDPSGTTAWFYNAHGDQIQVSRAVVPGNRLITSFSYQPQTNLLASTTYPAGRVYSYQYDNQGRLSQIDTTVNGQPQTLISDIQYQPFAASNHYQFGNGLLLDRDYDLDGRLSSQTVSDSQAIQQLVWGYNPVNSINSIDNQLDASQNQNFDYDSLDRLTSAQTDSSGYGQLGFDYDGVGNRVQKDQNSQVTNYTPSSTSNQIESANGGEIQSYQYDARGNTTQRTINGDVFSYRYNQRGRLTEVDKNSQLVASYQYNGLGQRVSKTLTSGETIYYLYNSSGQLVAEIDAQGETQKEYIYFEGQPLAMVQNQASGPPQIDIMLDNDSSAVTYSDQWTLSTSIAGYQGDNYQYHAGEAVGLGLLGIPIDNLQASFTGSWTNSTSVNGYLQSNYQYHAGESAAPGILGSPIDNLQASYIGSWTNSTSVGHYYESDYQYHASGAGANSVNWYLNVTTAASYDLYASWTASTNRASNAKYTIHHSNGSDTVSVNQQQDGGQWNLLGTYTLDNASTVSLSDDANGYVIADGITILPAGTPPNAALQIDTANWVLNASSIGSYDVYASWTAHPNRATDAQYTINHSGGSDTVTVNQQQNGGQWNLLGTYTLDNNSTVDLSSVANGYVIADAITILPADTPPMVTPQGETASWAPNQVGDFAVYATWTAHSNRASNATYSIHHLDGSTEITVNQRENGGQWDLLGTYSLDASSTINLSSIANGYVIADAIRLTSITSTLTEAVYYYHNDYLGTPQQMTDQNQAVVWAASYNPFGKASVSTGTISNHIRFPGQYFDEETGLHYNYFRYYDPKTGRYIQSDPIGLRGGLNTYAYVGGNPVNFVDSLGLARRQGRPLDIPGLRNTTVGPLQHDRFQYGNGSDSGYYGDGTVRPDNAPQSLLNQYQDVGRWFDDNALQQAEQNVQNNGWFNDPYNLIPFNSHQCQDYADEVEREYDRITGRWVNTRRGRREQSGWRQQWWRP